MKTPLWFPQSFFARTLWLVLIVVLFSKALTLPDRWKCGRSIVALAPERADGPRRAWAS
jgi:hypothetical protein